MLLIIDFSHGLLATPYVVQVATMQEAQRTFMHERSEHGAGSSDCGLACGLVFENDTVLGRVSYNGTWRNASELYTLLGEKVYIRNVKAGLRIVTLTAKAI